MPRSSPLSTAFAIATVLSGAAVAAQKPMDADVFAWTFVDPGFESERLALPVTIGDLEETEIARRLASRPEGRRGLLADDLATMLAGDPADRVVVGGRITDHASPWLDAGERRTSSRFKAVAKALSAAGVSVDAVLLKGSNPIAAESLDTADDLVWMAIRNDARFKTSAELTLAGSMTPVNPQWSAWNRHADDRFGLAIDRSIVDPLRESSPEIVICRPPVPEVVTDAKEGSGYALRFVVSPKRGDSTSDAIADLVESAVGLVAAGSSIEPRVLPYSHPGTRGERNSLAGTAAWAELVRHAVLLGGGRVVHEEDRSGPIVTEDARRLVVVLDDVAEAVSTKPILDSEASRAPDATSTGSTAEFAKGAGFFASGSTLADGDLLWRISFDPGFGAIDAEVDGDRIRIVRARGAAGAWHRTRGDAVVKFGDRAARDEVAHTGGGLVPAEKPSLPTLEIAIEKDTPRLAENNNPEGDFGGQDLNGDGVVDGADLTIYLSGGVPEEAGWTGAGWEDLNGDGIVDGADLAIELAGDGQWNGAGWDDLNGDGIVDGADLAIRLAGETGPVAGDLNGDGVVDGADLAIKLAGFDGDEWGSGGESESDGDDPTSRPRIRIRPRLSNQSESDVDESQTGASPFGVGGGASPSVDNTIPITPPSQSDGSVEGTPVPAPTGFSFLINEDPNPGQDSTPSDLGLEPVYVVYQGVDPNAEHTGLIDAERVATRIRTALGPNASGYLMLDFEEPFLEVIRDGPAHPAYTQTVDTMNALVHRVRSEFPDLKITHYGLPVLPYWLPTGGSWAAASPEYRAEMVARFAENARPVLDPLDWISPTVYDRYDAGMYTDDQRPNVDARERAFRVATMDICNRYQESSGLPRRPAIPSISPTFAPGGTVQYPGKLIPIDELLRDQVDPLLEGGADGVMFWHTSVSMINQATSADSDQPRQAVRRTAISRNLLGADSLLSTEQLQELGFTGWNCATLRQHLFADMNSRISATASHVNTRVLQLHPASASPTP